MCERRNNTKWKEIRERGKQETKRFDGNSGSKTQIYKAGKMKGEDEKMKR